MHRVSRFLVLIATLLTCQSFSPLNPPNVQNFQVDSPAETLAQLSNVLSFSDYSSFVSVSNNQSGFSRQISPTFLNVTDVTPEDDLAAILMAAPDGETVKLAEGTFILQKSVNINKSITIIGAGRDKTKIISETTDILKKKMSNIFSIDTPGAVIIKNLTITDNLKINANIIHVTNGQLAITDCQIEKEPANKILSFGVYLEKTSEILIDNCVIAANGMGVVLTESSKLDMKNSQVINAKEGAGVYIKEKSAARVTMANNQVSDNKAGIVLYGNSQVDISHNKIENNEQFSIAVSENVSGSLTGNQIDGGSNGIFLRGTTAISIENNSLNDMAKNGIVVTEKAAPTIKGNTIKAASTAKNGIPPFPRGIQYSDNTAGMAVNNSISGYKFAISSYGSSKPVLDGNTFSDNETGIEFDQNSAGIAQNNQIIENDRKNEMLAFYIHGQSTAKVIKNIITGVSTGIMAEEKSKPIIDGNTFKDNQTGILFKEEANGISQNNQFINSGIAVMGKSTAVITGNDFQLDSIDTDKIENYSAINLSNSAKVIKNTITGYGTGISISDEPGVKNSSAVVVLDGNTLKDNVDGIYLSFAGKATLQNNEILNTKNNAIEIGGYISIDKDGKQIYFSPNPVLTENTLKNELDSGSKFSNGILFDSSATGTASKNTITGFKNGIAIRIKASPKLNQNTITGVGTGIAYTDESGGVANGNQISNSETGIHIMKQAHPVLQANEVFSNENGIIIDETTKPTLSNNKVHDNTTIDIKK